MKTIEIAYPEILHFSKVDLRHKKAREGYNRVLDTGMYKIVHMCPKSEYVTLLRK